MRGNLAGWNATNPPITVSAGATVSVILSSDDIVHQFAVDLDNDTTSPTGMCPVGDTCSPQFGLGPAITFTFNAPMVPGDYSYFCTFHPEMLGRLIVVQPVSPLTVTITGISPNPADTGIPVTVAYTVANPSTLSEVSVSWGDGTVTHPNLTASSDTHVYSTTSFLESQTFTINVTATNSQGEASAMTSETVNDRPPTFAVTSLSPSPANTGQTVTLNFTASDPDGIVQATWIDWGDGSIPHLILTESSGSMCQRLNPSLQSDACTLALGDLLFSLPEDPASIVNGSIIVFRPYPANPNYLVTHRVVRIIQPADSIFHQITFWTMGDANPAIDGWDQPNAGIPASQVVAVYQYTLPSPASATARFDTHTYSAVEDAQSKTFTVRVNATDNSGLTTVQNVAETVNDRPPILSINSLTPNPAKPGQTVTISFSATDPDGTISSFTVNWGDGSAPDTLPASAISDTHTYARAGSFTITLTATDNSGSISQASSVPVTVTHHQPKHHRQQL